MSKFDQIQVPKEANFVIMRAIKKGKRYMLISKVSVASASLLLSILVFVLSGVMVPQLVQTISDTKVGDSVSIRSYSEGLKNVNEKGLVEQSDITITFGENEIAIKEIYYDASQISLSYIVKAEDQEDKKAIYVPKLLYKGEMVTGSSTQLPGTKISKKEYAYEFTMLLDNRADDLPVFFDCEVDFIKVINGISTDLNLRLNVPLSRQKADLYSKKITLNKTFQSEENALLLKKIFFTPSNTRITYEVTGPEKKSLYVKIKDENNQVINSGEVMNANDGGSRMERVQFFDPFEEIPKKIKIYVSYTDSEEYPWLDLEIE